MQFDELTHTYTLGDKVLISTTQLLQKHDLSPNYEGIDEEILYRKAEYGTLIHKEIEDYIVLGNIGFTAELGNFIDYIKQNKIKPLFSELKMHNDIVAGTCDLILNIGKKNYLADIKTTYTVHKESVSWQLSIYTYLANTTTDTKVETDKGYVYHFLNTGELEVIEIPLKPVSEVEALLNSERAGELYQKPELDLVEIAKINDLVSYYTALKEEAEKKFKEMQEAMMNAMLKAGMLEYENSQMKITIVRGHSKKILEEEMDSEIVENYKLAKAQYDLEAKAHTIQEPKKPYLKITFREEKE